MNDKQFNGRSVIVTGATRGIGKSIALELARRGCNVAFNYSKSADEAEKLKAEVEGLGVKAHVAQCDVANTEASAEFVKATAAELGTVDLLVNNAGITRDTMFHRMTPDQWSKVINTNLSSLFKMCRQVIDGMRERNFGRSVNISSINGQKGQSGQGN